MGLLRLKKMIFDLEKFEVELHFNYRKPVVLLFEPVRSDKTSRRFYFSLVAYVVSEMMCSNYVDFINIFEKERLKQIAFLDRELSGKGASGYYLDDKEERKIEDLLKRRITRLWKEKLSNFVEPECFKFANRARIESEISEIGDMWSELFQRISKEKPNWVKFALDDPKINLTLDDVKLVYKNLLGTDAWEKFVNELFKKSKIKKIPKQPDHTEKKGVLINNENTFDDQNIYYRAGHENLITAFETFISERTKQFIGRKFILSGLDNFLGNKENESGYFIIKGEPGIGKSAFIAWLVKKRRYIYHFNISLQSINKPRQFLNNICGQIIAKFRLKHLVWPNDADKDGAFLNQVLLEASKTLGNEQNIVIAIDALDEVDLSDMPHRANVLYLPPTLPPGVFIIATTRRKYDLHLNVTNFEVFDIEANSEANKRDARIYIEYRLDKEMMARILEWNISVEQCVDTLLEKSETNFMYLRHVMPAVKKGQFKEGRLDELPKGLIAYYRSHWNQMRKINSEKFDQHYQPIICVLAAVEEAVTAKQISNFTGIDSLIIQDVIREWFEFLSHEFSENREPIYRLYHTAFKEFLQQEVDPGLKKYHRMIADYYL